MSFTKDVMANGQFSLRLRDDIPYSVLDQIDIATAAFASIVITPTEISDRWTDATGILAKSIYTGVTFHNDDALEISGHHASCWLGDPSGIGDINEYGGGAMIRTFKQWVNWAINISGYVALGTANVEDIAPVAQMNWDPTKLSPREVLDNVCTYFRSATGNPSIEWRVRDSLTVDAGTAGFIYGTSPKALLSPDFAGPDPVVPGLLATLHVSDDVEEYATRDLFGYAGGGGVGVNGAATPYKDGLTNTLVRKRRDSDTNVTAANATNYAASVIDQYDQPRRQMTAESPRAAIMLDLPCGSYVYAWDQFKGIYDYNNQITWRGTVAHPILTRVLEVEMPFEAGMGAFLIVDGTTVMELTRWIVPESPGANLKLESMDRKLLRRPQFVR